MGYFAGTVLIPSHQFCHRFEADTEISRYRNQSTVIRDLNENGPAPSELAIRLL